MKIKPLGDRVLIEPLHEEKKHGSIILPDTVEKEKPEKGRIVAVGAGSRDDNGKIIPIPLKKGDIVHFRKYDLSQIAEKYLIGHFKDLLAVEEK